LGNHELAQWTGHWIAKDDQDVNNLFREGVAYAYGAHADDVYAHYVSLFSALPVAVRTSNRVLLTHSFPSAPRLASFDPAVLVQQTWPEKDLIRGGAIYSLVWGRDTTLAGVSAFLDKMDADWLITGHIPCDKGFEIPNDRQIILDAKGTPAAYCQFDDAVFGSLQHLVGCIKLIS
jgi:hypothetical protein